MKIIVITLLALSLCIWNDQDLTSSGNSVYRVTDTIRYNAKTRSKIIPVKDILSTFLDSSRRTLNRGQCPIFFEEPCLDYVYWNYSYTELKIDSVTKDTVLALISPCFPFRSLKKDLINELEDSFLYKVIKYGDTSKLRSRCDAKEYKNRNPSSVRNYSSLDLIRIKLNKGR